SNIIRSRAGCPCHVYQCQIWFHAVSQSLPLLTTLSGSGNSTPWRSLNWAALSTVPRSTVIVVGRLGTYGLGHLLAFSAAATPSWIICRALTGGMLRAE